MVMWIDSLKSMINQNDTKNRWASLTKKDPVDWRAAKKLALPILLEM